MFVTKTSSTPLCTNSGFGQARWLVFRSSLTNGSGCGCGWQRSIEVMQQWLQLDGLIRPDAAEAVPPGPAEAYADPKYALALPATKTRERVVTPLGDVTVYSRESTTAGLHPSDMKVTAACSPAQQADMMRELQASGACVRASVRTRRRASRLPRRHRHVHRPLAVCGVNTQPRSARRRRPSQLRRGGPGSICKIVKHSISILKGTSPLGPNASIHFAQARSCRLSTNQHACRKE